MRFWTGEIICHFSTRKMLNQMLTSPIPQNKNNWNYLKARRWTKRYPQDAEASQKTRLKRTKRFLLYVNILNSIGATNFIDLFRRTRDQCPKEYEVVKWRKSYLLENKLKYFENWEYWTTPRRQARLKNHQKLKTQRKILIKSFLS